MRAAVLWGQNTEELAGMVGLALQGKNKTRGFCLEEVADAVVGSRLTLGSELCC